MSQTFNLSRGTKFYVSTVNAGWSTSDTFRVNILNGYTFSQGVATQEIGLKEAGNKPVRGQKIFNTAINPADFSFSTYLRPYYASSNHNCVEKLLWESLVGPGPIGTNVVPGTTKMVIDFENSDVHELLALYMYFELDSTTYRLDNAIIKTAVIDFAIDSIAKITWSGNATAIVQTTAPTTSLAVDTGAKYIKNRLSTISLTNNAGTTQGTQVLNYTSGIDANSLCGLINGTTYTGSLVVDGGSAQSLSWNPPASSTYQDLIDQFNGQVFGALADINTAGDIVITSATNGTTSTIAYTEPGANDLFGDSTGFATIDAAVDGTSTGKVFNLAITGGSLSLENNTTFLTPEELGVVNSTIGSFTGTRKVMGTVSAYLRTGSNNTAGLLADMVAATSTVTHNFAMSPFIGGVSNTPRVELVMKHAHLVIPAVSIQDVLSVDIAFTGLGQDISQKDEITVNYIAQ